MKKGHIVFAGLAVLFVGLGTLLLHSMSVDEGRVQPHSTARVEEGLPLDEQKEERQEQTVSPSALPRARRTGSQQSPAAKSVTPAPNQKEALSMGESHKETTQPLTEEDEAVLALSQEVESPVPLGPEFEELTPPDDDTLRVMALHEALYESPGIVLAQGQNTAPVGPMQIETYRVEEVVLPQATKVEIAGQEATVHTALRVTITGGPFPVGALPLVVWINNTKLGFGQPSPDLSTITAVTFDRSLLHDGATLAISYGENGVKTKLPEKLKLGVQP
jgi:hypothetical protein